MVSLLIPLNFSTRKCSLVNNTQEMVIPLCITKPQSVPLNCALTNPLQYQRFSLWQVITVSVNFGISHPSSPSCCWPLQLLWCLLHFGKTLIRSRGNNSKDWNKGSMSDLLRRDGLQMLGFIPSVLPSFFPSLPLCFSLPSFLSSFILRSNWPRKELWCFLLGSWSTVDQSSVVVIGCESVFGSHCVTLCHSTCCSISRLVLAEKRCNHIFLAVTLKHC